MWNSLPRTRTAPPPPPHRPMGGTFRKKETVDVQRLRLEIDILSEQLKKVKEQLNESLEQNGASDMVVDENQPATAGRDSRLSTVLFSPMSDRIRSTPTPLPSGGLNNNGEEDQLTLRRGLGLSFSSPQLPQTLVKRASTLNSMSSGVPRLRRRELLEKTTEFTANMNSKVVVPSLQRLRRIDAPPPTAPPKPARTYAETLDDEDEATLKHNASSRVSSRFPSSSVVPVPDYTNEELITTIKDRFRNGQCWFARGNELLFVNPFNDISSANHISYHAVSNVSALLTKHRVSALVLRGVSGSGKSQLAEMVCLDLADRLEVKGSASAVLYASLLALKPFITCNTKHNNQASKAVQHFEIHVREGRLSKMRLRHYLIESPSRGCRANIFAIMANDMTEQEKEQYKICGFRLRDNYSNYGSLDDVKAALTTVGVPVGDVFCLLAACTLLNNLVFKEMKGFLDIENLLDLEDAAYLLGVSALSLYRTLMTCTLNGTNTIAECQSTRDELVSSLYSRLVHFIMFKSNQLLDQMPEFEDNTSSFNDSGIGLSSGMDCQTIHVVDVPGYMRSTNNSLTELLVNTINDTFGDKARDTASQLLQKIELSNGFERAKYKKQTTCISHCDGLFEVDYETHKMAQRNRNNMSKDLVALFDKRSCTFELAVRLFAEDVPRARQARAGDDVAAARTIVWDTDAPTVIQNVLESTKRLLKRVQEAHMHEVVCMKSNEKLEFGNVEEKLVVDQLRLFTKRKESPYGSCIGSNLVSLETLPPPSKKTPLIIPDRRTYAIRDGKKHVFPQRRNIVVDFQDQTSGVFLRSGDVVKAIGFAGECYIVETGRRMRAAIPISFTEKSLPPSEENFV